MDKKRKSLIGFYAAALIVLLLFNIFVSPLLFQPQVTEITYDQFVSYLESGQITAASLEERMIMMEVVPDPSKPEETSLCMTAYVGDPDMIQKLLDADVTFKGEIPQENSPLLSFLLSWVLPIGIFVALGLWMSRMIQKKMGPSMSFGKSNAKIYAEAETGKTFADVAGQDEAKESLLEIVDFLHNPERYRRIGAQIPKGVLLVGPPGTGKTLIAKAVAGEAHVPFFSIAGSDFIEMFVGMGASRVRDLFKQAQEKAPCIVFIDEIDTIGKKRDSAAGIGGNDEREQTLNQLLSEMDGFDGSKGVIILGATNRPDSLDKALLRPGRFDRRVPMELPDLRGREAILKVHSKDVQMDPAVDLHSIALATPGASGAELANIINEAALGAVRAGHDRVLQEDLDEAVETVIAGQQRKGAVISPQEKRTVAYPELAPALAARESGGAAPVHKITIVPRTSGALGYTMQVAEDETLLMTREEMLSRIATLTGGRAAEELVCDSFTTGASNDIEQATKLARAMVTRLGMSDTFDMMALETVSNAYLGGDASLTCSAETAAKVDAEVLQIIKTCHERAKSILAENRALLDALAAYLLEKETITGEEFEAMVKQHRQKSENRFSSSGKEEDSKN